MIFDKSVWYCTARKEIL